MAAKKAILLLADGAEEMEAVITIDTLRRGGVSKKLVEVTVAGIAGSDVVTCSRNVKIQPDSSLDDALTKGPFDAVVLPGGLKGAEALGKCDKVKKLLMEQEKEGRLIGAICAAPAVSLMAHGIGEGKHVTSYPSFKDKMVNSGKYTYEDKRVVEDDELVTSQGPGTAIEFGIALVKKLMGQDKAAATAKPMLVS